MPPPVLAATLAGAIDLHRRAIDAKFLNQVLDCPLGVTAVIEQAGDDACHG